MRICILPIFSISNLAGASELLHLSPQFFKRLDGLYFYHCIPKRLERYIPEKLDNVKYIIYNDEEQWNYYDQVGGVGASFLSLFNERIGKYPIDCVWSTRTALAASLSRMLWDSRTPEPSIPMFIEEFKACDYGKTHNIVNDLELAARSLGYVFGYGIFNTPVEKEIGISAAMRYLAPSMVKKIDENSRVIGDNVDIAKVERAKKKAKLKDKFTLFFGGRLNEAKRAKKLVEIYDRFFRFGRDVNVLITSPRAESGNYWQRKDTVKRFPEVEFKFNIDSEEFLKEACSSHVIISTSKHEGFTVGVLEMMCSGAVMLLPNEYWVKGLLLDFYDKYPFIYKDFVHAQAMLREVYDNYEEARKKMKPEMIAKRWFKDKNVELLELTAKEVKGGDCGEPGKQVSLDDFYNKLVELSDNYRSTEAPTRGKMSRFVVYKWLSSKYKDLCQNEIPEFIISDQ